MLPRSDDLYICVYACMCARACRCVIGVCVACLRVWLFVCDIDPTISLMIYTCAMTHFYISGVCHCLCVCVDVRV